MNKPCVDPGAVTHQVGNIIFEKDVDDDLTSNTFIHAIVNGQWRHVGGVWKIGDEWSYYAPVYLGGSGIRARCASALDGVNTVLRITGVVKC